MRNKPLVDVAAKVAETKRNENLVLDADEVFAIEEQRAARRMALWLGCCPDCFEDLRVIDGRWVCLACRAIAEAMQGG